MPLHKTAGRLIRPAKQTRRRAARVDPFEAAMLRAHPGWTDGHREMTAAARNLDAGALRRALAALPADPDRDPYQDGAAVALEDLLLRSQPNVPTSAGTFPGTTERQGATP